MERVKIADQIIDLEVSDQDFLRSACKNMQLSIRIRKAI